MSMCYPPVYPAYNVHMQGFIKQLAEGVNLWLMYFWTALVKLMYMYTYTMEAIQIKGSDSCINQA